MKPAIFTLFDRAIPFDRAIGMIQEAGFEVVSLGARDSNYATAEGRAEIRRLLEANGMTIDSLHAPFPEGDRLFSLDEAERLESICQCQIALDAATELDGKIVVIHLIQPYGIPQGEIRRTMVDQGRRSVQALAEHAERQGVRLALENGQKRDYDQVLIDFLAEFECGHVGFCYDSGHENVQGTCFTLLEKFADRLFTVHLHDNNGSDIHVLPFEGTINWGRFREILPRLHYSGNLLLEVDIKHSQYKDHAVFLSQAGKCAEKLRRRLGIGGR